MSTFSDATDALSHLLFIDKNLSALRELAPLLREKGYALHLTSSFDTAREYLHTYPIAVTIIDLHACHSDEESGFAFALWLREQSPYAFVDLIFTSRAYAAKLYKETTLLRYQALDYLEHPISHQKWLALFHEYERGDLSPPLQPIANHQGYPQPHTQPKGEPYDPDQFLLDPEEWVNQVFHNQTPSTQDDDTQPHPPPAIETTHPTARPTTESGYKPPHLHQTQAQVSSHEVLVPPPLPTEPHTDLSFPETPTPQYVPQFPTLAPPNHIASQQLKHTPRPPSISEDDPERERPTQALSGLQQPMPPIQSIAPNANILFQQGLHALQTGALQQALQAFQEALQLQPRPHHRAYYGWTLALTSQHDAQRTKAAEMLIKQAISQSPQEEQHYLLLGQFYKMHRRLQEAFDTYQTALTHHPHSQELYREFRILQLQMTR